MDRTVPRFKHSNLHRQKCFLRSNYFLIPAVFYGLLFQQGVLLYIYVTIRDEQMLFLSSFKVAADFLNKYIF